MKTVSFQGTTLSSSERRRLDAQKRPFLNPLLSASVDVALEQTEQRKAAGEKAPRLWEIERKERGTPYLGDIFNFERTSPCQNSM